MLTGGHMAAGRAELLFIRAVADDDRRDGVQALGLDVIEVDFGYQIADLHPVAFLDTGLESLALEAHGVQTHMDQDFQAVI